MEEVREDWKDKMIESSSGGAGLSHRLDQGGAEKEAALTAGLVEMNIL